MSPETLPVIVGSLSCLTIILVILTVVALYRKYPLCCRFRPHRTERSTDDPLHFHSRNTLVGIAHNERSASMNQRAAGPQLPLPGRLFVVGKQEDYHLNGVLPRLPSYESVRKKDRQRQIRSMISQRFGLSGCHDGPPPTYEEALRRSHDISPVDLHPLDVHLSVHTQDHSSNTSWDARNATQPFAVVQGPTSSHYPVHCSRILSDGPGVRCQATA